MKSLRAHRMGRVRPGIRAFRAGAACALTMAAAGVMVAAAVASEPAHEVTSTNRPQPYAFPPPALELDAPFQQFRRNIRVIATCSEDCTVVAEGRLRIRIRDFGPIVPEPFAATSPPVGVGRQLGSATRELSGGQPTLLKLKLTRRGRAAAQRAIRRGHGVKANLKVTAIDQVGNEVRAKTTAKPFGFIIFD